jgi:peptidyl-prolyl cis-trans isomerase SurA
MKKFTNIIKGILLLFVITFLTLSGLQKAGAKSIEILIKINNEIITNYDIEKEYKYLIALNNDLKLLDKKQTINIAKNSIIREKVKKVEILKHYNLDQNNDQIEIILKRFYEKLEINNLEDFRKYLNQYDLSIEEIKEKLLIESLWNKLIVKKYINRVEIDKEKIKKEVRQLLLDQKKQNNYLLSEIVFELESGETLNQKYEKIKKSVSDIGFKNSSNIYSISDTAQFGGKLGWVEESQLSKNVIKSIKNLKINEISAPIEIQNRFIILKVDEKKYSDANLNFDGEYNRLINIKRNKKLTQFSLIHFKKIKNNLEINER